LAGREIGVVLLNMGGPATLADIRPFLRNMFRDPAILPMPAPVRYAVAELIAQLRFFRVRTQYAQIGGGSPIGPITQAQADVLRKALAEQGVRADVTVAMRYTRPRAEEALLALPPHLRHQVVALPLYPQFSFATTASSLEDLARAAQALDLPPPVPIRSWHDEPSYRDDLADRIRDALGNAPSDAVVLFSAHGLPERSIRRGDPYRTQIEETIEGVVERLGDVPWRIGFQSRVGPVRWTGPDTLEVVEALGREGRPVLVVPIAFVSDHVETLYELDVLVGDHARSHGVPWYERLPAQNASERFGRVLARVVLKTLGEGE
jgi:ferrochelatase